MKNSVLLSNIFMVTCFLAGPAAFVLLGGDSESKILDAPVISAMVLIVVGVVTYVSIIKKKNGTRVKS
jgi:hypothetical protein